MLLVEKGTRRESIQFDPIKIISPEQYVPLYVANLAPFAVDHNVSYSGKYNIWTHTTENYKVLSRGRLKELLTSQLNHSYSSEYSFSIPVEANFNDWGYENYSNLTRRFLGGGKHNFKNAYVSLGLVVEGLTTNCYNTLKQGSLYSESEPYIKTIKNLNPTLLILIKAKYIPIVRAKLYLQLKMDLPLDGMKVLYTSNNLSSSIYLSTLVQQFIDKQKPICELVNKEYMFKYLIPYDLSSIVNKSKHEVLKSTLEYIEEEEKELELI